MSTPPAASPSPLPPAAAGPRAGLGWFDADDPPARFDLRACVHCGLCLPACPTYRQLKSEPDSPRGRIYLMRGLAEERIGASDDLAGHLDLCLGCRACETACPAGVPYGRMLEEARGQFHRRIERGGVPRALGEWALRTLLPDRDLVHAAADVLRLGQRGPLGTLLRSRLAQHLLPAFATNGLAMTPPLEPRDARKLEAVARELPAGARMEARGDALVFVPAGTPRARAGFFTSCVMEVMFPRINRDCVRLLVLAGCEVVVPREQTCCGALHAHTGLRDLAKDLARRNIAAFTADLDWIVSDSAGCGAALRDCGDWLKHDIAAAGAARFAGRVRDVSEVLAELGLPEPAAALASAGDRARPLRVGYHDACHLAHAQRVREQPRVLLARLPGIELVDLPDSDWCCGSAGVYNLAHPAMAVAQLRQKLDAIDAVQAEVVVASNPGCMLHTARGIRERGSAARVVHLVELLARAYPPPGVTS